MKKTISCIRINCPFIGLCKDYDLYDDKSAGCHTLDSFLHAAKTWETKVKPVLHVITGQRQPNPNYVPPASVRRDK